MPGILKPFRWVVTDSGCWECTSHRTRKHGYPYTNRRGVTERISRYLYIQAFGKIPKGLYVRHKCDNRECIRLDHLEVGTHSQNTQDQKRNGTFPAGEKNPRRKLTWEQVREIRNSKEISTTIGPKYGISPRHVLYIRKEKNWRINEYGEAMI